MKYHQTIKMSVFLFLFYKYKVVREALQMLRFEMNFNPCFADSKTINLTYRVTKNVLLDRFTDLNMNYKSSFA